eukprot:Partr_v1_DN27966_c1_g1_i2_m11358 putative guanine nucleotide exchange factor
MDSEMDQLLPDSVVTACWAFKSRAHDELSFAVAAQICVLKSPSGGWWYGCLNSESDPKVEGWFPSNFVSIPSASWSSAQLRTLPSGGIRGIDVPTRSRQFPLISWRSRRQASFMSSVSGSISGSAPAISRRSRYLSRDSVISRFSFDDDVPPHFHKQPVASFCTPRAGASKVFCCSRRVWTRHTFKWKVAGFVKGCNTILIKSHYAATSAPSEKSLSDRRCQSDLQWHEICPKQLIADISINEVRRQTALYELLQTERDFIRDMELVLDLFYRPLKEQGVLNADNMATLFGNLEMIVPVNRAFCSSLEDCYDSDGLFCIKSVGAAIRQTAHFFKIYTKFCSNYTNALMFLQSCPSSRFQQFITIQSRRTELRQLPLGSFLIKPVQRICKYPLLIQEILKYTPDTHFDRASLKEAQKIFESVVSQVNDGAKQAERVHRMAEIAGSFSDKLNIIEPSRHLVKEGQLSRIEMKRNGRQGDTPVHFFLFNDLLIIGVRKDKVDRPYKMLISWSLAELLISPFSSGVTTKKRRVPVFNPNTAFQLIFNAYTKWIFTCDTAASRNSWMEAIGKHHLMSRKNTLKSQFNDRPISEDFTAKKRKNTLARRKPGTSLAERLNSFEERDAAVAQSRRPMTLARESSRFSRSTSMPSESKAISHLIARFES